MSHLNSLTHRFPRFPLRNLCSLVTLAVFSLVYAAIDTAFFWAPISPGLAKSRILPAVPADFHPRTPLISSCTVQLRTLCAARSLATLCSLRPLVQALGSCLASGAPWSPAMPPSLGRVLGNNTTPICTFCAALTNDLTTSIAIESQQSYE